MTPVPKNIVIASVAALILGIAAAASSAPAVADDAGPLGWTYNIQTGTYENSQAQDSQSQGSQAQGSRPSVTQGGGSTESAQDAEHLDVVSRLAL